jgi:hypothetical protein
MTRLIYYKPQCEVFKYQADRFMHYTAYYYPSKYQV